nr:VOC family protein [Actinomycetales bacterium]
MTLNRIASDTHMGTVDLRVSDLDAVLAFYTDGVGLTPLSVDGPTVTLGLGSDLSASPDGGAPSPVTTGTAPVVTLTHAPDLRLPSRGSAGLYHTAILFPTAAELASSVYSLFRRFPHLYQGASDHLVSRAFYWGDPEGNGVELYIDRSRDEWTWENNQVSMATLALDPRAFLTDHLPEEDYESDASPSGMNGSIGHVHLQVGDVETARDFYVNTIGFDETASFGDQALFVSAGGYHHHMAMNTWQSRGAGPRQSALGLGRVDIVVPTTDEIEHIGSRLTERGFAYGHDGAALLVRDPWANEIRVLTA